MENLSNFAERLETLMFERGLNATTLSLEVGINHASISSFLNEESLPTYENLIKLADFFNCTSDFLLGLESDNTSTVFYSCPPFSEQLKVLRKEFGRPWCHFYQTAKISPSRFYEWKNGKHNPSVETIIKIAKAYHRSVDFIIGRAKY